MAIKRIDEETGWFRKDAKGREVIMWHHSSHFPINVGDQVECDGRVVTIKAIGSIFTPRDMKGKWAYLYLEVPVSTRSVKAESRDEDQAALEASERQAYGAESARELG